MARFALSRRDPGYVGRSEAVDAIEKRRVAGEADLTAIDPELACVFGALSAAGVPADPSATEYGSVLYARKPGDGSAREQAASCQRVLGGLADVAGEYATKRYRSNVMNWGMLPFRLSGEPTFEVGDHLRARVYASASMATPPISRHSWCAAEASSGSRYPSMP